MDYFQTANKQQEQEQEDSRMEETRTTTTTTTSRGNNENDTHTYFNQTQNKSASRNAMSSAADLASHGPASTTTTSTTVTDSDSSSSSSSAPSAAQRRAAAAAGQDEDEEAGTRESSIMAMDASRDNNIPPKESDNTGFREALLRRQNSNSPSTSSSSSSLFFAAAAPMATPGAETPAASAGGGGGGGLRPSWLQKRQQSSSNNNNMPSMLSRSNSNQTHTHDVQMQDADKRSPLGLSSSSSKTASPSTRIGSMGSGGNGIDNASSHQSRQQAGGNAFKLQPVSHLHRSSSSQSQSSSSNHHHHQPAHGTQVGSRCLTDSPTTIEASAGEHQQLHRPAMQPSSSSSSSGALSNKTVTSVSSPSHSQSQVVSPRHHSQSSPRNQQQQGGSTSTSAPGHPAAPLNSAAASSGRTSSPSAKKTMIPTTDVNASSSSSTSASTSTSPQSSTQQQQRSSTLPMPPTLTLPGGKGTNSNSNGNSTRVGGALAGGCGIFKLPSGACSSSSTLPVGTSGGISGGVGSSKCGTGGGGGFRAGISRAFCGNLSRKGAEVVQNPRFRAVSQPNEIRDVLMQASAAPASSSSSPSSSPSSSSGKQSRNYHHQHHHHRASASSNNTLVLDLRPHTAYVSQGRFEGSINICVPSTLLRRPNFALSKIAETVVSKRAKEHFESIIGLDNSEAASSSSTAPTGSARGKGTKILVLDQDTVLLSAETTVHSIMSKIEKSGYAGEIHWLRGGWNVLCNNSSNQHPQQFDVLQDVIDWEPYVEQDEDDDEDDSTESDIEMESTDGATDDMSGSQVSDSQDSKTPRQLIPGGPGGGGEGNGGAYFASRLQNPRSTAVTGRSSQSSFTSTASSDSLFPASVASSQSSVGSGDSKDRVSSTSPVASTFDSSKLCLPGRRSASPATTTATSSSDVGVPSKSRAGQLNLSSSGKARSSSAGGSSIVMPRNLPMAAFQYNSTAQGAAASESPQKSTHGRGAVGEGFYAGQTAGKATATSGGAATTRVAPFTRKTAANPFFDNIRQNLETQSLDRVLEHVAPFEIPSEFTKPNFVRLLPQYLQDVVAMSPKKRAEKLHKEYFDIEQAEQKRLQKVLDWHCQQSQVLATTTASGEPVQAKDVQDHSKSASGQADETNEDGQVHPFSISAGVEKGHLNRYKNMWPYEHARVRLETVSSPTCGDYINASHIRLRGTSKRYIASQGPLEQTTEHFWRLVMQEKVNVIVMLTLLQEGGRDKCSNYFQTAEYNDICVTLVEERGSIEAMKKSVCKDFGFFAMDEPPPASDSTTQATPAAKRDRAVPLYATTPSQASESVSMQHHMAQTPSGRSRFHGHKRSMSSRLDSAIVRRTIELRRKSDPAGKEPHVVRHIQYIKWPDFDIPPDPNVLVDLISETNRAQRDLSAVAQEEPPVLVHCSAGVGRTGTFIAVDTLLERYRQERRAQREGKGSQMSLRTRSRRTGSDVGSHLNNLALTEKSPPSPKTDAYGSVVDPVRPTPNRSHSSAEESPRHLAARLGIKELLPEDHANPIMSVVNQMREQRMSSVANAGQYIFTYVGLLAGIAQDLADEGALDTLQ